MIALRRVRERVAAVIAAIGAPQESSAVASATLAAVDVASTVRDAKRVVIVKAVGTARGAVVIVRRAGEIAKADRAASRAMIVRAVVRRAVAVIAQSAVTVESVENVAA